MSATPEQSISLAGLIDKVRWECSVEKKVWLMPDSLSLECLYGLEYAQREISKLKSEISEAVAKERAASITSGDLQELQKENSALKSKLSEATEKMGRMEKALETIRSKNGLQYSDIFAICDEALSDIKNSGGKSGCA